MGALRSPREAAIYTATSSLAVFGSYALQAIGFAIAPQFSFLLARDDHDSVHLLYRVSTWWLMAIAWPFYLILITCGPLVLGIFGSGYRVGHPRSRS